MGSGSRSHSEFFGENHPKIALNRALGDVLAAIGKLAAAAEPHFPHLSRTYDEDSARGIIGKSDQRESRHLFSQMHNIATRFRSCMGCDKS